MIKIFKAKPVEQDTFTAIKYTGDNFEKVVEFVKDAPNVRVLDGHIICMANDHIGWFLRPTDYICKLSNGNFVVKTLEEMFSKYTENTDDQI